jgi:hypothetical protein
MGILHPYFIELPLGSKFWYKSSWAPKEAQTIFIYHSCIAHHTGHTSTYVYTFQLGLPISRINDHSVAGQELSLFLMLGETLCPSRPLKEAANFHSFLLKIAQNFNVMPGI